MATSLVRRVLNAVAGRPASRALALNRPTPRKTSPFESWTDEQISTAVQEALAAQTIDVSLHGITASGSNILPRAHFSQRVSQLNPIAINRAFFQGDHWQGGEGWIGPHPELDHPAFREVMAEIAANFTSKNVIKEVTLRHALGVTGRNTGWGFTPVRELEAGDQPTAEEQTLTQEATKLMRNWIQSRHISTLIRNAVCTLLLSERAGIKLSVPSGLADEADDGTLTVRAASIEEALAFIYADHPLPDFATVITDHDTKMTAGVWQYTGAAPVAEDAAPASGGESSTEAGNEEADYTAICFVNEAGETVTRIYLPESSDPLMESTMNLGGRLLMHEMRRTVLISVQVQQAQRALNLAESMIPRTAVTAGFLERLLIDAQMPADPEKDADGNETGRWIERPFYVGAGTTNFIQSSEYMDEEGKVKRGNASVHYREPTAATGPITASEKHYQSILDETGQQHIMLSGNANPSGASRLASRVEYLNTLQLTQAEVESAWRFILDTTLAMAEQIAGMPGHYTSRIKATAACRLDAGPVSAAERTAIEESIGKTLSRQTAMTLLNIEDTDAEMTRMAEDQMSRAVLGKAIGDALAALTTPGASLEGAAKFIGIDAKELTKLLTVGDVPAPATPPVTPAVPGAVIPPQSGPAPTPAAVT